MSAAPDFAKGIRLLNEAAIAAASAWFKAQSQQPSVELFLYYRKARPGEPVGEILVAEERPEGPWEVAMREPFRPSWTKEQAQAFINQVVMGLPLLGHPDEAE